MFYVTYVDGIQKYKVGPFNTMEEAQAEFDRLVSAGKSNVMIEFSR